MTTDETSFTTIEVEPNDNCAEQVMLVYKNISDAEKVAMVRLFEGEPNGRVYAVTGWMSAGGGTPCPAHAVQVEDSGSGVVQLVYGGDWGLRLRPAESAQEWSLDAPDQRGETHLLLADAEDIFLAEG